MVATLDRVFREEWGRPGHLIGFLGDFDLAEEAAQGVLHRRRPMATDGIPALRAWLMRTARNRCTDRIRRDRALATKVGLLVAADQLRCR